MVHSSHGYVFRRRRVLRPDLVCVCVCVCARARVRGVSSDDEAPTGEESVARTESVATGPSLLLGFGVEVHG